MAVLVLSGVDIDIVLLCDDERLSFETPLSATNCQKMHDAGYHKIEHDDGSSWNKTCCVETWSKTSA